MMTVLTSSSQHLKTLPWVKSFLRILGGSLFIAFCAQVKIPLLFTPVPLSLQTLAVALVAGMLGRKLGTLAVIGYLAEITMGLPFLAGGAINSLALIGSNGGYLIGMVIQAYLVGWFYDQKMGRRFARDFCFNALSGLVVIVMGTLWLGNFVGSAHAMLLGFYPFLLGDVIKSVVATRIMMNKQRIRL